MALEFPIGQEAVDAEMIAAGPIVPQIKHSPPDLQWGSTRNLKIVADCTRPSD